jgi:hypothetical protein
MQNKKRGEKPSKTNEVENIALMNHAKELEADGAIAQLGTTRLVQTTFDQYMTEVRTVAQKYPTRIIAYDFQRKGTERNISLNIGLYKLTSDSSDEPIPFS